MSTPDGYSWGPWSNYFRLGLWSGISGTTVTVYVYGQSDNFGHAWNSTLYFTGGPSGWAGSMSVRFDSPYNTSVTKEFGHWSYSYVGSYTFGVSMSYWDGYSSASRTVQIDNPLPAIPAVPGPTTVVRTATGVKLSWTHGSGGGTRASYEVWRQVGGGSDQAWKKIATLASTATTYSDDTFPNYMPVRWQVGAANAGGSAYAAATKFLYWSLRTPPAPTLTREATSVTLTWPPNAIKEAGTEITRTVGGTDTVVATLPSVASGSGPTTWTDTSLPAGTITYKIRQFMGDAGVWRGYSAFSPASTPVVTITKPNPPSNLAPNGALAPSDGVPFTWQPNPVDGSTQTQAEVRYRKVGTTAWTTTTVTGATPATTVALAAGDWEWQVRSWGAHADPSDWSATATATVIDRPTVAINSPSGTVTQPGLTAIWGYFQAQSRPQAAWKLGLYASDGELLEEKAGSGPATQVKLDTLAANGSSYKLRVEVATGGIWSTPTELMFSVVFIPPHPPGVGINWDESSGSHMITLTPQTQPGKPSTAYVDIFRSVDSGQTWESVAEGAATDSILQDFQGLSNGTTTYRILAYSSIGAVTEVRFEVLSASGALWLSGGAGYATTARLPYDPDVAVEAGRERSTELYDERPLPVAYAGEHVSRQVKAGGTLVDGDQTVAARTALHALTQDRSPIHLYRDPSGYRIYGSLSSVPLKRRFGQVWSWSFMLDETDH